MVAAVTDEAQETGDYAGVRTMRCAYCGEANPWDRHWFPVPYEALCRTCIERRDREDIDKRERLYAMRESHMTGASLTLFLHLIHPYAAATWVLFVLVLWLYSVWQMRHHPAKVSGSSTDPDRKENQ